MGEIDKAAKKFMSNPRVFADLFNYQLYGGKIVMRPESLVMVDGNTTVGKRELKRDVTASCILAEDDDRRYSLYLGVENQAIRDNTMPLRVLEYDVAWYRKQVDEFRARNEGKVKKDKFISGLKDDDRLKPMVSLVLYFGLEPWEGPLTLHDMLDLEGIPKELAEKYVADYRMNFIPLAFLTDEDRERFGSELSQVSLALSRSNDKAAFLRLMDDDRFRRLSPETASLIKAVTKMKLDYTLEEDGTVDMCKAWEEIRKEDKASSRAEGVAEGRAEGMAEGRAEGMAEGRAEGMAEGRAEGMDLESKRYSSLLQILLDGNQMTLLREVVSDSKLRETLYKKYGLA